jgi:hypothetical protein
MYALSGNYEVRRGFLYNSGGFTPIDDPNAGTLGTSVNDISGNLIVGSYFDSNSLQHGFIYDGASYQNIDDPLANTAIANSNQALGIFGNTIVGSYYDNDSHGYIYDGTQFHTFDDPAGHINFVTAVDGNKMVGTFFSNGTHGYLYDGTTFKTIDDPLAGNAGTEVNGISGNYIVGSYEDASAKSHGFLFDGSNYFTVDYPGSPLTVVVGIDGNTIVGYYDLLDPSGTSSMHGFIATVPEPSTCPLAATGLVALLACCSRFGTSLRV